MVKMNNYIKKNIINIISFLIVIQPAVDLLIGISIKIDFFPSFASLIRMIILLFLIYCLIFINDSKSKKKAYILLTLIFVYLMLFFVNMNFSFDELKAAVKVFYFPLLFIILWCIFEDEKTFINREWLLYALLIYGLVIIVGCITNTAFDSYLEAKEGTVGYFNAANEVGGTFAILLPLVFAYVFNKINIKKVIYFLIILGAIIIFGTKTPFISLMICSVYYVLKSINKKNIVKVGGISIIGFIAISLFVTKTPFYENLLIHYKYLEVESVFNIVEKPELFDHFVLGSRLKFLKTNHELYLEGSINEQLLGMGYIGNPKLSEMDFHDIFHRQGIVGFGVYFISIITLLWSNRKRYTKQYILPVALVILISLFVGHIITAPAVATFAAIVLCGLVKEEKHES